MTDERRNVAQELRRVRDEVRSRTTLDDEATPLPPARPARPPQGVALEEPLAPTPPSGMPDATGANESVRVEPAEPRGLRGLLFRALDRLLGPRFEAQRSFNEEQARLDNAILKHIEERSAATRRHYDEILGIYRRHLEEIDERHTMLQRELVAHVEDLVRRIDAVLSESERGRLSLEHELEDLRRRVEGLPDVLGRGA